MTVTLDFHETHAWSTTFVSSSCAEFHENAAHGLVVDTRSQTDTRVDRQAGRRTWSLHRLLLFLVRKKVIYRSLETTRKIFSTNLAQFNC